MNKRGTSRNPFLYPFLMMSLPIVLVGLTGIFGEDLQEQAEQILVDVVAVIIGLTVIIVIAGMIIGSWLLFTD